MKKLLQFLLVFALACAGMAQETSQKAPETQPARKFYKLTYLIYELEDGKKINERSYNLPLSTENGSGRRSSMRVGNRVPIATGKEGQIQYLDVGLDLNCEATELADKLMVNTSLELSSIAVPEQNADPRTGGSPVVRNVRQNFTTVLTPGKPTLVTTSDDVNSKKRLQVEITATRID